MKIVAKIWCVMDGEITAVKYNDTVFIKAGEKQNVVEKTKVCRRCKKELPITNFYERKDRCDGFSSYCKVCQRLYSAEHKIKKENVKKITVMDAGKIIGRTRSVNIHQNIWDDLIQVLSDGNYHSKKELKKVIAKYKNNPSDSTLDSNLYLYIKRIKSKYKLIKVRTGKGKYDIKIEPKKIVDKSKKGYSIGISPLNDIPVIKCNNKDRRSL